MGESVVAVVVTYNRKNLLRESIEALIKQHYDDLRILVVDNNSTDGTYNYIEELINNKRVCYSNTGANLGGAGGFNYGIRMAVEMGADYVWVMDDDCIVHDDTLIKLLDVSENLKGKYGFLSSKVLWKDGNICEMNIQRRTLSKNVRDFDTELVPVAMASFVSLFLPSSVIRANGLPIKDFFIWTDDWEYTRRLSRKYPCYLVNSSVVTHKSKNNIGAKIDTDEPNRLDRYNYLYRNDMYLYRREGIRGFFYVIPRLCWHIVRVLKSKCKDKKKRIKIIVDASRQGLKFDPEIEYIKNENG